jgi:two-component system chemotaxis response regulator CheY
MVILIVDDSKAMRLIVMRALRQAGFGEHKLVEANDGAEALSVIQSAPPDLVLCDWNMPKMNGIELLRTLQSKGLLVKFGFVTSEVTADTKQLALDSGALFLITKPFTPETFRQALAPVLAA